MRATKFEQDFGFGLGNEKNGRKSDGCPRGLELNPWNDVNGDPLFENAVGSIVDADLWYFAPIDFESQADSVSQTLWNDRFEKWVCFFPRKHTFVNKIIKFLTVCAVHQ